MFLHLRGGGERDQEVRIVKADRDVVRSDYVGRSTLPWRPWKRRLY